MRPPTDQQDEHVQAVLDSGDLRVDIVLRHLAPEAGTDTDARVAAARMLCDLDAYTKAGKKRGVSYRVSRALTSVSMLAVMLLAIAAAISAGVWVVVWAWTNIATMMS